MLSTRTSNHNFSLPIDLSKLANNKLSLIPFDSDYARFSSLFVSETCETAPRNFDYLTYGPFATVAAFQSWYEEKVRPNPHTIWFAILLKKCVIRGTEFEDGTFAGTIAFCDSEPANALTEIGHVNFLPAVQRSFVGSNASGLLLHYALNPPPSGLGLRRVQWEANENNQASVAAAQRLGFRLEGVLRWRRVIPSGKPDNGVGEGELPEVLGRTLGPGRHTVSLSICWDDWRDEGKAKVDVLMNRQMA